MDAAKNTFQKRTYSIHGLLHDVRLVMQSVFDSPPPGDGPGALDRAFAERIMLAVTQVNDCRYCDYGHSLAALRAGVAREELDALRSGEFSAAPEEQLPALLFAQHYAAEHGRPEREALETLVDTYGDAQASRIMLTIRMITVGNLLGNTFDALLVRLQGQRVAAGSALQESGVLLLTLISMPILLLGGLVLAVHKQARRLISYARE